MTDTLLIADDTGTIDVAPALRKLIENLQSNGCGGGTIEIKVGRYRMDSTVIVPSNVRIVGSGQYPATLFYTKNDITVFELQGGWAGLYNLQIQGCGIVNSVDIDMTAPPTQPVVRLASGGICVIDQVNIYGGGNGIQIETSDCMLSRFCIQSNYGEAHIYAKGNTAGLRIRDGSVDQSYPAAVYPPDTIADWQPNLEVKVGSLRRVANRWTIQCMQAGKTDSKEPLVRGYFQNITDGTAIWQFNAPYVYAGLWMGDGASEITLNMMDLSGGNSHCVIMNNQSGDPSLDPFLLNLTDCTLGAPFIECVMAVRGSRLVMNGCHYSANDVDTSGKILNFMDTFNGDSQVASFHMSGASNAAIIINGGRSYQIGPGFIRNSGDGVRVGASANRVRISGVDFTNIARSDTLIDGPLGRRIILSDNFPSR